MVIRKFLTLWLLAFALAASATSEPAALPAFKILRFAEGSLADLNRGWQSYELRTETGPRFVFRLWIPAKQRMPAKPKLLVFLDGSASTGFDNLEQMRHASLLRLFESGQGIPAIVLIPQLPADGCWDSLQWSPQGNSPLASAAPSDLLRALMALILDISSRFKIEAGQRILAGYSLGGFGALDAVIHFPDAFAACVAIAACSDAQRLAAAPGVTRILLFHGEQDQTVAFSFALAIEEARRLAQKPVSLTRFPNSGHEIVDLVMGNRQFRELINPP